MLQSTPPLTPITNLASVILFQLLTGKYIEYFNIMEELLSAWVWKVWAKPVYGIVNCTAAQSSVCKDVLRWPS